MLSRELALENFDYFMATRAQRVHYLTSWLKQNFDVDLSLDLSGIVSLSNWGNKYAGLLGIIENKCRIISGPYYEYIPEWDGECAGYNVIFDMGTALGEALIRQLPAMHWAIAPNEGALPRIARARKKDLYSGYQRPELAVQGNKVWAMTALDKVLIFCGQMSSYSIDKDGVRRFKDMPKDYRLLISDSLINEYESIIKNYPHFDPNDLRHQMSEREWLSSMDEEGEDDV